MAMTLDPEQLMNAQAIVQVGRQVGATDEEIVGALSAGWSESRFRTNAVGDNGAAVGLFQQHPHYGSTEARRDPFTAARQFFANLFGTRNSNDPIGVRVANVQRPAAQYRAMYGTNLPVALDVFAQLQSMDQRSDFGSADTAERQAGGQWQGWQSLDEFLRGLGIRVGDPTAGQTTGGTHVDGSYHYLGLGRDYGASSDRDAIALALLPFADEPGDPLDELFYSPLNIFYDEGRAITPSASLRSGHQDHVHVALDRDGRTVNLVGQPISNVGSAAAVSSGTVPAFLGVLQSLDDALNKGGGLTNPVGTGKILIARAGVVAGGITLTIFGLVLLVSAVGRRSDVRSLVSSLPGPAGVIAGAAERST
jgi:hypothetical protein